MIRGICCLPIWRSPPRRFLWRVVMWAFKCCFPGRLWRTYCSEETKKSHRKWEANRGQRLRVVRAFRSYIEAKRELLRPSRVFARNHCGFPAGLLPRRRATKFSKWLDKTLNPILRLIRARRERACVRDANIACSW